MVTVRRVQKIGRLALFVLIATLVCGLAPALQNATASATKGASLLKACLGAMAKARSVHWASTTNTSDPSTHVPVTVTITSDASQSSGSQVIVFKEGGKSGTEQVRLVNRTAYVYADTFALERFNAMTAAEARHFEDLWIAIASRSSAYGSLAAGLTVSSLRPEIDIPSPELVGTQPVVMGHKTELLDSTSKSNGALVKTELYVQSRGSPLPVEEISITPGGRTTTTFSSWGERVRVSAPPNSVPLL